MLQLRNELGGSDHEGQSHPHEVFGLLLRKRQGGASVRQPAVPPLAVSHGVGGSPGFRRRCGGFGPRSSRWHPSPPGGGFAVIWGAWTAEGRSVAAVGEKDGDDG